MGRLRDGFDYPLPKTYHEGVKGGRSVMASGRDAVQPKTTPMLTPGPTRYNPVLGSVIGQIRSTINWARAPPRFKEAGAKISKTDVRNYNPEQPSRAPKWSMPKGKGHTVPRLKTFGADVFYDVKKDYVDCAQVGGEGGILVQGAVQGLGTRPVKCADLKLRPKAEARVKNYPQRPGPGTYANQQDAVLDRPPCYTQTKCDLDKARFPGSYVLSKRGTPPPGTYEWDDVVKKGKNCNGARLEQQLGHASSFGMGAS
ncbi:unnamed protein product [Amoebophrya sp. A120]|nr:unnamed protein product [Amoebophrya sp. A120]|eukprot:GSA120T00005551001.1